MEMRWITMININENNKMKKFALYLILILLSNGLYAQSNDTILSKEEGLEDGLWKKIEEMTLKLAEKDKIINKLKDDSLKLQTQAASLNGDVVRLRNENLDLKSQVEQAQLDKEQLSKAIISIDGVLAKQCLLYPLERRYNKTFVEEALNTVKEFGRLGKTSERFNGYRNTYEPLLEKYFDYNQEIVEFLNGCIALIEKQQKSLGDKKDIRIPKEMWNSKLCALDYYRECYVVKDDPPYKSIIFLDERIDEIKDAIQNSNDVKSDFEKIIEKMLPKSK